MLNQLNGENPYEVCLYYERQASEEKKKERQAVINPPLSGTISDLVEVIKNDCSWC